jgi:hypothetical protein
VARRKGRDRLAQGDQEGCVSMRRAAALAVAAIAFMLLPRVAWAQSEEDTALFRSAVTDLSQGRPGEAILNLESLADHGVVDAAVSFNRGLAYANRVRVGGEQQGDLGEAAHGFLEAARLANDGGLIADANRALATIRAEVGRRRARAGEPVDLDPGLPLGPSIVRLLDEDSWALVGVVGSFILGGALVARRSAVERRSRIAATVTGALAGLVLVGGATASFAARHDRLTLGAGVIVTAGARPTNDRGLVIPNATPIPEAAEVSVLEHRAGWAHVRWGTADAWIPAASVRPISELARR